MKKKFKFKKLIFIVAILYGSYVFAIKTVSSFKIQSQIESSQKELERLKEKNLELQDEVKMSKSDTYIERLARERLGLIKEGETPVIDKNK